ncbi:hypothetical protein VTK73DRAFT_8517 [Phialemonium thermophilum]|uniref:Uncharacterized protein n=1 Tax=Phialemonium thermophilum TaxID=223376 RepID=A0ABR3W8C5_9PEZI
MPRKRKAESVSPADNSVVDSADTEVRRSRRISAKDISREVRRREVEEEDSSSPGMDRSVSPDHSSISTVFEGDGVVQHAVEGLAKLQRNLQREARRRKREVQQSNVPTRPESLEPGKPPGSPGGASTVVPRMRKMPTDPGPAPQDGAEKGGYEATAATAEGKQREAEFTSMEDDKGADVGAARPPAVNSSYLPLPWKGRLGYACLNTYLRTANPPVFSSRTCRTASILEHRHPLRDPSMPEHATKNRPDKTQEAVEELGHKFVQNLGLANARDIVKMIRWNDKYGIKFMRLSSEMFPFASHLEYGYRLAPFASEVLAEAGKVIAELGHRVTMHPGQVRSFPSSSTS